MKKLSILLVSFFLAITILIVSVGCTGNTQTFTLTETQTITKTATVTETVTPITITDDLGREVTLEGIPSKIVSLAPSNTEILYALGLEDKLVGVTEQCNYPEEAMGKEKVGGFVDVDMEKVIAINPDLILAFEGTHRGANVLSFSREADRFCREAAAFLVFFVRLLSESVAAGEISVDLGRFALADAAQNGYGFTIHPKIIEKINNDVIDHMQRKVLEIAA